MLDRIRYHQRIAFYLAGFGDALLIGAIILLGVLLYGRS